MCIGGQLTASCTSGHTVPCSHQCPGCVCVCARTHACAPTVRSLFAHSHCMCKLVYMHTHKHTCSPTSHTSCLSLKSLGGSSGQAGTIRPLDTHMRLHTHLHPAKSVWPHLREGSEQHHRTLAKHIHLGVSAAAGAAFSLRLQGAVGQRYMGRQTLPPSLSATGQGHARAKRSHGSGGGKRRRGRADRFVSPGLAPSPAWALNTKFRRPPWLVWDSHNHFEFTVILFIGTVQQQVLAFYISLGSCL